MTLPDGPHEATDGPAPVPERLSFKAMREAVQTCRACELWEDATQAVMGTGPRPSKARLMMVGEQPGDREDIEGRPFVGPAGRPERVHGAACRPWLDAERTLVEPEALVCLGATAAQALLGSSVRIGRDRGRPMESDVAPLVMVTTHPSAILRQRGVRERTAAMDDFVVDLESVAGWLAEHESP